VKNHDFFFKVISNALTTVSYFNPLAYISCSTAQREREMLADERAVELLEKPSALADALAKICKAIENLPKESVLVNFSSNLLVTSSVLHRVGILSTHPKLDTRLRNISAPKLSTRLNRRNTYIALLLSLLLIFSAIAVSLAMVDLQLNFTADFKAVTYLRPSLGDVQGMDYQMGSVNATFFPGVLAAPFNNTQTVHVLIYSPNQAISPRRYADGGYNGVYNAQEIPVGEFMLVPPQNSSYSQMQEYVTPPGAVWIG
jgi:hypothetical protein